MWLTLFRCCLCIEIPYHQRWELPIQGHRRWVEELAESASGICDKGLS
jgi:hypothetical protein